MKLLQFKHQTANQVSLTLAYRNDFTIFCNLLTIFSLMHFWAILIGISATFKSQTLKDCAVILIS